MDGKMFSGIEGLIKGLFFTAVIFVPFGLWKMVEIGIWL
jgi:uncharacterized membrane protein